MLVLRKVLQVLFAAAIFVTTVLSFVFVVPVVLVLEALARRRPRGVEVRRVAAFILLVAGSAVLAGCTGMSNTVSRSVDRAGQIVDRAREFSATAPTAPYEPIGSADLLAEQADVNDLLLTGSQLTLISGAATIADVEPALLAYVVEQELRHLDENELDRDVLGALAGEDTSVGVAQVKVSTAQEVEEEDQLDLFPLTDATDESRTELIRRLAADDWNVLYAAAYLALLEQRHPGATQLDLATRYTGAAPGTAAAGREDPELFDRMTSLGL